MSSRNYSVFKRSLRNKTVSRELDRNLGLCRQEVDQMAQLLLRYREYRRVGFHRMDAFHFAWLVVMSGAKPIAQRAVVKR